VRKLLAALLFIPTLAWAQQSPEVPVTLNVTASGDTTVIAAPGASINLCILKGWVQNRDASNVVVALTDGAAGTARFRVELRSEGGGAPFDFGDRGWCLAANTALVANTSGATSIDVTVMEYYLAK
jgi:hypothetical protein